MSHRCSLGFPQLRKGLGGRGPQLRNGRYQAIPSRSGEKTNRSRLSPRRILYTWFIPPNPHAATQPQQPSQGGAARHLLWWDWISRGVVGKRGGALAQGSFSVTLPPAERGERREEGVTELGFKYSRSYMIEDKSSTLQGKGSQRNQSQIPPTSGGVKSLGPRGAGWGEKGLGVEEPEEGPTLAGTPGHRASEAQGALHSAMPDRWRPTAWSGPASVCRVGGCPRRREIGEGTGASLAQPRGPCAAPRSGAAEGGRGRAPLSLFTPAKGGHSSPHFIREWRNATQCHTASQRSLTPWERGWPKP